MTTLDLIRLLELAENITRHRGFLGQRETDDLNQNKSDFAKLRRSVVHGLAKREGTFGLHKMQLEAALFKVSSEEEIPQDAFNLARGELLDHLAKEHKRGYLARLLVRWGPPILALFLVIILHLVKFGPNWIG